MRTLLLDPFAPAFMRRALLEAVLMGGACGLLGALVVPRGMTYQGEATSHFLLAGAALGLAAGAPPLAGALVLALAGAAAVGALGGRARVGEDVATGVVFTGLLAVGVLVLSTQGGTDQLQALLFGSIMSVGGGELWLAGAAAAGALAVAAALARPWLLAGFDRAYARSLGLRPAALDLALALALAAALAAGVRGVGTLLVLALLVAPYSLARLARLRQAALLWLSPALGVGLAVAGLLVAYHADAAPGPAIALVAVGAALAVAVARGLAAVAAAGGRASGRP